jgi:membrane protein insertase Oxa1/YidC/SpoIIIJ
MLKGLFSPLILFLKYLYLGIYQLTLSPGLSLIGLSLVTAVLVIFLNRLLDTYVKREQQIQAILEPQIITIKEKFQGQERHQKLQALYKRYAYHPLLALRSSLPLFLQIPFLLSAFYMIGELGLFKGKALLGIPDLSKPDGLLLGINLLPLLMTLINLTAAFLTPEFRLKDKLQAILIALLFLALLYGSPSALLVYWTMNNLIFLVRTVIRINRKPGRSEVTKLLPARDEKPATFRVGEFFKHYFGILVLFYFVQAIAVYPWYMFCGIFKYVPFAIAAYMFWTLQVKDLLGRYRSDLKHNLALILVSFDVFFLIILGLNTVAPLVQIDCQIYTLFHYVAFLLGISGFAIGMLLFEPGKQMDDPQLNQLIHVVVVAALIPALHFAAVNPDYLRGIFYLIYLLVIILFAVLSLGIFRLSCSISSTKLQTALTAGVFSFSMISLPLLRFMLKTRNDGDFDFWIMAAVLLVGSFGIRSKQTLRILSRILLITLAVFCVSFGVSLFHTKEKDFSKGKSLTGTMQKITLADKPNIYLFIYDGIPNERVFRNQNLPFDKIRALVDTYGFKLYSDTYALGEMSLDSMGNMLDMSDRFISKVGKTTADAHDTYAGNSYTNLILRKNGYKSHFLLNNYYVGINAISNKQFFEEMYPPRDQRLVDMDFFVILLRGIFQGEMNFDTKGWIENENSLLSQIQNRKHELIMDSQRPKFVVNHLFLPGHSQNSGVCLPNETENWEANLSRALVQMEADFATVVKNDPSAIVIAIGDHGPSLTGDCYRLAGWPKSKITPDLIWDRIGTMVAIRWPDREKAARYDSALVTNQDVFPIVFAYLMDDPFPLSLCPNDTFYGFKTPGRSALGFDKGNLLP